MDVQVVYEEALLVEIRHLGLDVFMQVGQISENEDDENEKDDEETYIQKGHLDVFNIRLQDISITTILDLVNVLQVVLGMLQDQEDFHAVNCLNILSQAYLDTFMGQSLLDICIVGLALNSNIL